MCEDTNGLTDSESLVWKRMRLQVLRRRGGGVGEAGAARTTEGPAGVKMGAAAVAWGRFLGPTLQSAATG